MLWFVSASLAAVARRWPATPAPASRSWSGKPFASDAHLMHPHTDLAHRLWAAYLQPGDRVVDATAGNGHDTLAIVRALGAAGGGACFAVDLQPTAIAAAKSRLREALTADGWSVDEARGGRSGRGGESGDEPRDGAASWLTRCPANGAEVELRWATGCHVSLLDDSPADWARVVVFNLGYLPGGDKSVVTTAAGTQRALRAAERVVQPGGCVSATLYPGHTEGEAEAAAALEYASELPMQRWSVYHHQWLNQRNKKTGRPPPSLLHIQKIHDGDSR